MTTNIVFLKKPRLKNPMLLVGLPGIGLVGKICVDYMLKQFNAEKIAEIYSESFPPSVHTKDAKLELIHNDLFVYEFKRQHFLFLGGPAQPSLDFRIGSTSEHYEFASKIVDAAKALGVKEIYTLAGMNVGDKRMGGKPAIIVAVTSERMLGAMKALGARADEKEGLISGAAGLILGLARQHGIEGACLMGETNVRLIYGDHGAAKSLIEFLVKRFGFKVDMSRIEKEAKNIEKAFEQMAKQFEEPEEKPPAEGPSYIR